MSEEKKEYGILIYDVPVDCKTLYHQILKKIRRRAIRMNLSVYLIPWGMRDEMQTIMDRAMEETSQHATVEIMKFDNSSNEVIERLARESLRKTISEAMERLAVKVNEVQEEAGEVSRDYYEKTKSYVQDAQVLAGIFGFEQDLAGLIETARRVWQRQWDARAERIRINVERRRANQI